MAYEKDPYDFDHIPAFAMQPAREADEYNEPAESIEDAFDPTVYERALRGGYHQDGAEPQASGSTAEEKTAQEPLDEPVEEVFGRSPAEDEVPAAPVSAEPAEATETAAPAEGSEGTEEAELASAPVPVFSPKKPERSEDAAAGAGERTAPAGTEENKSPQTRVTPVGDLLLTSKLNLVDIRQQPEIRVMIEEDILVPDVKPDLASVISMDGKVKVAEKEIYGGGGRNTLKLTGDLILQTLYTPETTEGEDPLVAIESRLSFKNESDIHAEGNADLAVTPIIEHIEFTVVNERKFRVKAQVAFRVREYSTLDVELFEGIQDEEVQLLKEKIRMTDVALRKNEIMEVKEELQIKESMPAIRKILKYDVNVVENHKQITKEKAVVNAAVYCNIMYLGEDKEEPGGEQGIPVLYQARTEFTQFIKLDDDDSLGIQSPAGSRVSFDIASLSLTPKSDGDGQSTSFDLALNVNTNLEIYKNIEKEMVTDVYHHIKDIHYDTDEIHLMNLTGSGVAEVSVREIINVPEKYGAVDRIAYISGNLSQTAAYIEQGKSVVEGIATLKLICTASDDKHTPFSLKEEIPFRSVIEIPGIRQDGMHSDNELVLKELWFDRINNRQIEANASIVVTGTVSNQDKYRLIRNVGFAPPQGDREKMPGIILYITKAGDTIWKIAKRYRTTIDEIKKINGLEHNSDVKPGTKLLVVTKSH